MIAILLVGAYMAALGVVLAVCAAAARGDRALGLKGDSRHLAPAELRGVGASVGREGYRRAA
jgi:hypothetical protein